MWPNPRETADLVTFTEEILYRKLYFLCSVPRWNCPYLTESYFYKSFLKIPGWNSPCKCPFVWNKVKRVFQEDKARQVFLKTNISYPVIRTRTCVYQGVRNVRFFGKLGMLCFLETPVLRFALLTYYRRMDPWLPLYYFPPRLISKYGPEKTLYLDTFHIVIFSI